MVPMCCLPKNRVSSSSLSSLAISSRNKKDTRLTDAGRLTIYSIRMDAKKISPKRQQYKKQNLLKREFSASRLNEINAFVLVAVGGGKIADNSSMER